MARRDTTFVVVAVGLAAAAWFLLRPKAVPGAALSPGTAGGAVPGSPNQVVTPDPTWIAAHPIGSPGWLAL